MWPCIRSNAKLHAWLNSAHLAIAKAFKEGPDPLYKDHSAIYTHSESIYYYSIIM